MKWSTSKVKKRKSHRDSTGQAAGRLVRNKIMKLVPSWGYSFPGTIRGLYSFSQVHAKTDQVELRPVALILLTDTLDLCSYSKKTFYFQNMLMMILLVFKYSRGRM